MGGGLVVDRRNSQGQWKLAEHGLLLIQPSTQLGYAPTAKIIR